MGRFHTIAGYFKEVTEQQPVQVSQNVHAVDGNGQLMFEADGITPVVNKVMVDTTVNVPVRVWVDQVNVPFTPEEEAIRDVEEAQHEIAKTKAADEAFKAAKKAAIDGLTFKMSEQLLMTDGNDADIKLKYRENRKLIESMPTIDALNNLTIT